MDRAVFVIEKIPGWLSWCSQFSSAFWYAFCRWWWWMSQWKTINIRGPKFWAPFWPGRRASSIRLFMRPVIGRIGWPITNCCRHWNSGDSRWVRCQAKHLYRARVRETVRKITILDRWIRPKRKSTRWTLKMAHQGWQCESVVCHYVRCFADEFHFYFKYNVSAKELVILR